MSVDYTIKAYPTMYRGRQYRSRLEARWAAFFDGLGLSYEYEPYDLGAWSPDFHITNLDILVEVKPLSEFDQSVWDKAIAACNERGLLSAESDRYVNGLFLTRVAPTIINNKVQVGWFTTLNSNDLRPAPAYLGWLPSYVKPTYSPDLINVSEKGWWSAGGDADMWDNAHQSPRIFADHTMGIWAEASNKVQWQADHARGGSNPG